VQIEFDQTANSGLFRKQHSNYSKRAAKHRAGMIKHEPAISGTRGSYELQLGDRWAQSHSPPHPSQREWSAL